MTLITPNLSGMDMRPTVSSDEGFTINRKNRQICEPGVDTRQTLWDYPNVCKALGRSSEPVRRTIEINQ
jgi:hypothetical protein